VVLISILLGMSILGWSVLTLWKAGRGTPAPLAPTEKIVTSGPYRYCRNPIQLGGSFYFLGVVTLFGSLLTGIIAFVLTLLGASAYHKLVEEKELLLRFGDDYRDYMESTPFIIPGLKCWRKKK
jgi:protein-S-isoprenylcysteine O-methyltransferase Ste14